ncbi:MAG: hypothetical protein Q8934_08005 [Bacillota bacterium]|nr:hypothetical protein [Bacillota bacterium]
MNTILFALGTMLIVLITIFFLPLGFTKKGKIIVVLISFFLAVLGIASTASFPLWKSVLILFALLFFIAYFLDAKGKSFLYLMRENEVQKERILAMEEQEFTVDREAFFETFKLSNNEIAITEHENVNIEFLYTQSEPEILKSEIMENIPVISEDDTTFLLNRSIETKEEKDIEVGEDDFSYLSEIEGLLNDMDEGST